MLRLLIINDTANRGKIEPAQKRAEVVNNAKNINSVKKKENQEELALQVENLRITQANFLPIASSSKNTEKPIMKTNAWIKNPISLSLASSHSGIRWTSRKKLSFVYLPDFL